jgi:preprotein translocase subunit SecG
MTFLYYFAIVIFMLLCVLLCIVILMQESKSSGLGASFGGEASESLFGTATADILKKFTAWLSFIFLASCILLSLWTTALGHSKTNVPDFLMEKIEP